MAEKRQTANESGVGLSGLLGGCRPLRGLVEIESEVERLGHLNLARDLKQHIYELSVLQSRLMSTRDEQAELLERALAIISDAIMHGMPITKEVAAVRNEIVGVK